MKHDAMWLFPQREAAQCDRIQVWGGTEELRCSDKEALGMMRSDSVESTV